MPDEPRINGASYTAFAEFTGRRLTAEKIYDKIKTLSEVGNFSVPKMGKVMKLIERSKSYTAEQKGLRI